MDMSYIYQLLYVRKSILSDILNVLYNVLLYIFFKY